MKTDAVTRAYAGLSNKERAGLAFIHICRCDELELTRILDSLPRATYSGLPPEYLKHFGRLFTVASWWAIKYWQIFARLQAGRGGWLYMEKCGNMEAASQFLQTAKTWESLLMALETALDEVGAEYGLDPEAVHNLAECERFTPLFIETRNPATSKKQRPN